MSETQPLVEKYRPERWGEIQGNNKDVDAIQSWAENFQSGDEAQHLTGDPGVGKTSTAQVIAKEMGWPIEEINASDARRTDEIRQMAERMKLRPVEAEYQLVVLDEADSIPGRTNLGPLKDVLDDPPNPIVIISNDAYEVPDAITRRSNKREFSLGSSSIQAKLRYIAKQEEAELGPATLSDLAERKNLRDALQDLQTLIRGGELMDDEREYEQNPFGVVEKVVRGQHSELPWQFPDTPDEFIWWIDENIREPTGHTNRDGFRGVEAQVAFDLLARADKWESRSNPEEGYRYWKWATRLMRRIATVRLTDEWSGYRKMDYPSAKRKWPPSATGDSAEAQLYRALSGEDGRPGIGANFLEFRKCYLPILQDLSLEERRDIANEHGLEGAALKALDLKEDDYENWRTEEGSKMEESSVFDW